MKKLLGLATKWIMKPENTEKVVDGIQAVGKNKVDKKKVSAIVAIVIIIVNLVALLAGDIDSKEFNDNNKDVIKKTL